MVWKKKKQVSNGADDLMTLSIRSAHEQQHHQQQQLQQHTSHLKSCMKGSDNAPSDVSSSNDEVSMDDGSNSSRIHSLSSTSTTSRRSHSSRSERTRTKIKKPSCSGSFSSCPSEGLRGVGSIRGSKGDDDSTGPKMASRKSSSVRRESKLPSLGTSIQATSGDFEYANVAVRFSNIQIREYERVVSDNPSCTSGPPVGIGWKYGKTHIVDVNSYEEIRSQSSRKSTSRLILSREQREALLLNWGASFHDIVEAVRGNIKVKNQRRQTVVNIGKIERIEEAFESATKRLKRALMLRRSTGDKVKRLQEQANLAQSALTSLKIAEDRALREIRSSRMIIQQHMMEKDVTEDYERTIDVHAPSFSDSDMIGSHLQPSRRSMGTKQRSGMSSSFDTLDHSTTPSQNELERFYKELELEMFGDEELPSMVGQTLEITVSPCDSFSRAESKLSMGSAEQTTVGWIGPGAVDEAETEEKIDRYDVDDEALEEEMDRSMISQSLLDDIEIISSPGGNDFGGSLHHHLPLQQRIYPARENHVASRSEPTAQSFGTSFNLADPEHGSQLIHSVPLHLHAGMTFFKDCALLGGERDFSVNALSLHSSPGSGWSRNRSSSRQDVDAGPKVRHVPLSNHISPTQWMDEESESTPRVFTDWYGTVTINEDSCIDRLYSAAGSDFHQTDHRQRHYDELLH